MLNYAALNGVARYLIWHRLYLWRHLGYGCPAENVIISDFKTSAAILNYVSCVKVEESIWNQNKQQRAKITDLKKKNVFSFLSVKESAGKNAMLSREKIFKN